MLMPKRVKHRKVMRGRMSGIAKGGHTVAFGEYGLATQVRLCQISSFQARVAEVRAHQIAIFQICVLQIGAFKRGVAEICRTKVRKIKFCSFEFGIPYVCGMKVGT